MKNGDDARLAVGAARTRDAVAFNLEGTFGDGAFGEDRVEVGVEHDVVVVGAGFVRGAKTLARLRAEVDEFGRKAEFVVVTLHDFGDLGDALDRGGAAVDVYNFFEVLEIGFEHSSLHEKSLRAPPKKSFGGRNRIGSESIVVDPRSRGIAPRY